MPRDRFDHLFIEPEEFDRALAFYRDALGWNVIAGWGGEGEPRGAILDGGAMRVVLAEPHPAADHSKSHGIREHTPTLHLAVDDLEARFREVSPRADVVVRPEATHWGTRWFVLRDPDGNLIAYEERLGAKAPVPQDAAANPKPDRRDGGFSMMEALAVIAVVAILATLAIPSYLDKIIRDQVNEALPLSEVAKPPIAAAWAAQEPLPEDNAAAHLPAPDKIVNYVVSAVTVRAGAIDITFGNRANGVLKGKVLTLRPAVVDDAPVVPVTWVCGYAAPPDKMAVKGTNNTAVSAKYLPLKCRAR